MHIPFEDPVEVCFRDEEEPLCMGSYYKRFINGQKTNLTKYAKPTLSLVWASSNFKPSFMIISPSQVCVDISPNFVSTISHFEEGFLVIRSPPLGSLFSFCLVDSLS